MTLTYLPEPTTAAEVLERARAAEARKRSPSPRGPTVSVSWERAARRFGALSERISNDKSALDDKATRRLLEEINSAFDGVKENRITAKAIKLAVSRRFKVSVADMLAHRRHARAVMARQCAMYLCRIMTTDSLKRIGRSFEFRDHTTILHAYNKIQAILPLRPEVARALDDVRSAVEREAGISNL
jgi:chromosomal replication initiator protein